MRGLGPAIRHQLLLAVQGVRGMELAEGVRVHDKNGWRRSAEAGGTARSVKTLRATGRQSDACIRLSRSGCIIKHIHLVVRPSLRPKSCCCCSSS